MNETINTLINETVSVLNNLHFIRADWFYAFIPLFLYLFFSYNKTGNDKNWTSIIDPQLLSFVLRKRENKKRRYPLLLTFIAASLCITALAGPVYKKLPQPVYREQSSLVVLLDLSQSMNATDIKPSRLARAKLELLDILKTRKTGQTALVVYAADAFVVTPLTDDNATIANLVPSLETDMMPAQGSNLSVALAKTFSLFTQAGIINGNILVITDDIHQRDETAIKKIASQGHRLSIFGIGTTDGAPVPLDGGFLQDSSGAIVVPKLQPAKLQRYALSARGLYTGLQANDSDTNKLTALFQSSEVTQDINNQDINADVWQEEGHWLLLPLLFFAALWARKGWIAIMLLFVLPLPQPVYAEAGYSENASAKTIDKERSYLDTKHLWSSPDQKAMKAFNAGDNENAARQFTRPEWKASAYYRSGDYEAAVKALENPGHSDAYYNKANALAKLGRYEEAIKAYDKAIELNKNNDDAVYNREQVKKSLEKQKQQDSQQANSEQENSDPNKSDPDKSDQEKSDQNSSDEKNSEQQDSEQNEQHQQSDNNQQEQQNNQSAADDSDKENSKTDDNKQQPSADKSQDQQSAEEQQLKQRDAEKEKQQQREEQEQYEQQQNKNRADVNKNEVEHDDSEDRPQEIEVNPVEASITEEEKATEQWLKRIPDDPGGLLRRKFLYQYQQIPDQNDDNEPW
jgi:Ca-activated chloride channel family protein